LDEYIIQKGMSFPQLMGLRKDKCIRKLTRGRQKIMGKYTRRILRRFGSLEEKKNSQILEVIEKMR